MNREGQHAVTVIPVAGGPAAGGAAEVVTNFMQAFVSGDVPAMLSRLDPEFIVDETAGVPFAGRHIGSDGFLALLATISADLDGEISEIEILDAGASVVVRTGVTFISRRTGRRLSTTALELHRVSDGKITHTDVYYKDPGGVSALCQDGAS